MNQRISRRRRGLGLLSIDAPCSPQDLGLGARYCTHGERRGVRRRRAPVGVEPSEPTGGPDVAFTQYKHAVKLFDRSAAYGASGDAAQAADFVVMKNKAREHRDVVATWDAALGKIAFPAAVQPIVVRMRESSASESAGLNELAEVLTARRQIE